MPDVSVIVPVYNQELVLGRCLDSILNQSLQNIEIICIDDGSTDNSLDILNQYAKQDKRMIVINQKNCKVSCARNAGLEKATGEYITFVDPDDWIELDELKIAFVKAKKDNVSIVAWGYLDESKNGEYVGPKEEKVFRGIDAAMFLMNDRTKGTVWSKLYCNMMLKNSKVKFEIQIGKKGEDNLFNFDLVPFVDSLICLNKGLYHHVRLLTGLSKTSTAKDGEIFGKRVFERMHQIESEMKFQNYTVKIFLKHLKEIANIHLGRKEKRKRNKEKGYRKKQWQK